MNSMEVFLEDMAWDASQVSDFHVMVADDRHFTVYCSVCDAELETVPVAIVHSDDYDDEAIVEETGEEYLDLGLTPECDHESPYEMVYNVY